MGSSPVAVAIGDMLAPAVGMEKPSDQIKRVENAKKKKEAKDVDTEKTFQKKKASDELAFSKKLEDQKMARSGGRKSTLLTTPAADSLGTPTTGKTLLGQ